ncbi:MAG: alpha/beta hydrolase, partial [Chloroflexota bacterium]
APILECVQPQQNGSYTAYFGYRNNNNAAIDIPIGAHNRFSPGPQERGQPSLFHPGRTAHYPDEAFQVVFDGYPLVWTLNGQTATASNNPAQICS